MRRTVLGRRGASLSSRGSRGGEGRGEEVFFLLALRFIDRRPCILGSCTVH